MLARGCSRNPTCRISQYWSRTGRYSSSFNLSSLSPTLPTWFLKSRHHVLSNPRSFHGGNVCKQHIDEKQSSTLFNRFNATSMCNLCTIIRAGPILMYISQFPQRDVRHLDDCSCRNPRHEARCRSPWVLGFQCQSIEESGLRTAH